MRLLKIIALLTAVLIPAGLIGKTLYERETAPAYRVLIEGYDPRDLLYGHYLMFRFVPEKSPHCANFPPALYQSLPHVDGRYYIPERHARTLETILMDGRHMTEMEVGLPRNGKPFLKGLYIDNKPMRDFLRDVENGVDLDRDAERQ